VVHAEAPAPRWQLGALLGIVALILLMAFPYFERIRNANEIPRLIQAMSLVEQGEWAIDTPSRRDIPLGPDIARGADDRLYPNKPPGASVVGAAAYVLARLGAEPPTLREFTWWARLLGGIIPVLIIVAVAWGRLRALYHPSVVLAAIVLWVFGTPMFSYARLFYGHALAACLLFVGVVQLEHGSATGRRASLGIGSVLAAAAITVEYGAAFAGLPIAVMLLWPVVRRGASTSERRLGAQRAALAFGCALIPVLLLMLYQRAAFGSAFATGYHHAADPHFAELHGQGLLGLGRPRWNNVVTHLLARDTGLLMWSPLVIPAVIGLVRLSRHQGPQRRAARLHLAIITIIVLMGLGLSFEGGWRVGPRYLVIALPFLILGLAEFLAAWSNEHRTTIVALAMGLLACAAGWSLVANSLAATLWPHLDPTNIHEPFGAVLLPLWRHGFGPYGVPGWFGGGRLVSLALPVMLGFLALAWAGGRTRPQVVLVPMLLGFIAGVLTVVVVIPRSVWAHPATERNLHYIERVYEPRLWGGKRLPGHSTVLEAVEP
jgi:hypothetical protein